MNYCNAVKFVNNLDEFRYEFGLQRIKGFLDFIGNPQDKIKIIHVAGTNGKGSVCAYISTILQKAGYKVGLYTSPHLLDIRERIQVNRNKIIEDDFAKFTSEYSIIDNRYSLTYFEFLTAMAFWYFVKMKVDFAVVEVGLGGRLDATNVLKTPLISIITNISLEHTQYLGNTLGNIAGEKAGIIKEKGIVITSASGEALRVIRKIAKTKHANILKVQKNRNYKISLFGKHQEQNANLAITACRFLNIPERYIVDGLKKTVWPGRFEIRQVKIKQKEIKVILDGAHNPSGISMLHNSIREYFGRKINFVFGVLKDKNYQEMVGKISPDVKKVFVIAPKSIRALNTRILKNEFLKYISKENVFVCDGIKQAIGFAKKESEDFCIAGSIYTVSEGMKCPGI
ncbi:MAG: bifunctional folylpolyglutamate synthase/dihydrofolate synthase [Elusimicrobia bacterium]|nr:bifunctional folylpolyglutamate synthase/dihydrofolate synthase [Elusimicrobiota bacterium]